MQRVIETLFSSQLMPFWVFFLVFLVERFLPWPDKYHPLSLVNLLAQRMAKKVLHPGTQSARQQLISGSLAIVVLLLPVLVIIAVCVYLSVYPIFFEGMMLLVALQFQTVTRQSRKVTLYLQQHKKSLARQSCSAICLRETDKMSPVGIVKANIESLLLRFSYQYCAVFFWYIMLGGSAALVYRVLYEFSLVWNNKLNRFKHFGLPIRLIIVILQWFPVKLAGLSFLIAVNIRQGTTALIHRLSYQNDHMFVLNVFGASLGIELGGPAYYDQQKIRVTKCGGQRAIILADNMRTLACVHRAMWIWLTVYFVICAVGYFLATH